jgi:hypothetical protein
VLVWVDVLWLAFAHENGANDYQVTNAPVPR